MRTLFVSVLIAMLGVPVAPAATGTTAEAQVSEYHKGLGMRMLLQVREVLEEIYWDSDYRGQNLDLNDARAQQRIEDATTVAEVFGAVAQFVGDLGDSHTRFFPPGLTVEVEYGWTWISVGDDCYVLSVREGSDAEKQGLRAGDRVLSVDGLQPSRSGLDLIRYVYHFLQPRQGMRLQVERPDGTQEEIAFEAKTRRLPPEFRVTDLEAMRMYRAASQGGEVVHDWRTYDSVAVWRFNRFGLRDRRLDLYMEDARNYAWLILDLRGNPGGYIEALTRFLGHFFAEEFTAYSEKYRDSTVEHTVVPRGGAPYGGQVMVLVDSRSASSAEITARTLQLRGKAMIVGDRTAGAVVTAITPSFGVQSSNQTFVYALQVTITDVIMPDGNRLEGAGVIPNVPALPTGADLAAGRDPAMQFALEMAGVRMTTEEAGRVWND